MKKSVVLGSCFGAALAICSELTASQSESEKRVVKGNNFADFIKSATAGKTLDIDKKADEEQLGEVVGAVRKALEKKGLPKQLACECAGLASFYGCSNFAQALRLVNFGLRQKQEGQLPETLGEFAAYTLPPVLQNAFSVLYTLVTGNYADLQRMVSKDSKRLTAVLGENMTLALENGVTDISLEPEIFGNARVIEKFVRTPSSRPNKDLLRMFRFLGSDQNALALIVLVHCAATNRKNGKISTAAALSLFNRLSGFVAELGHELYGIARQDRELDLLYTANTVEEGIENFQTYVKREPQNNEANEDTVENQDNNEEDAGEEEAANNDEGEDEIVDKNEEEEEEEKREYSEPDPSQRAIDLCAYFDKAENSINSLNEMQGKVDELKKTLKEKDTQIQEAEKKSAQQLAQIEQLTTDSERLTDQLNEKSELLAKYRETFAGIDGGDVKHQIEKEVNPDAYYKETSDYLVTEYSKIVNGLGLKDLDLTVNSLDLLRNALMGDLFAYVALLLKGSYDDAAHLLAAAHGIAQTLQKNEYTIGDGAFFKKEENPQLGEKIYSLVQTITDGNVKTLTLIPEESEVSAIALLTEIAAVTAQIIRNGTEMNNQNLNFSGASAFWSSAKNSETVQKLIRKFVTKPNEATKNEKRDMVMLCLWIGGRLLNYLVNSETLPEGSVLTATTMLALPYWLAKMGYMTEEGGLKLQTADNTFPSTEEAANLQIAKKVNTAGKSSKNVMLNPTVEIERAGVAAPKPSSFNRKVKRNKPTEDSDGENETHEYDYNSDAIQLQDEVDKFNSQENESVIEEEEEELDEPNGSNFRSLEILDGISSQNEEEEEEFKDKFEFNNLGEEEEINPNIIRDFLENEEEEEQQQ